MPSNYKFIMCQMARLYQSYSAYHVTEVGYDDLVYRSILQVNDVKVYRGYMNLSYSDSVSDYIRGAITGSESGV